MKHLAHLSIADLKAALDYMKEKVGQKRSSNKFQIGVDISVYSQIISELDSELQQRIFKL